MSLHPYQILVAPLVTERAMKGSDLPEKKVLFKVALGANKIQIRRAVEAAFGVKVIKVNTIRMGGKSKRMGAGRPGKRPDWKKAIVTLAAGQEITLD